MFELSASPSVFDVSDEAGRAKRSASPPAEVDTPLGKRARPAAPGGDDSDIQIVEEVSTAAGGDDDVQVVFSSQEGGARRGSATTGAESQTEFRLAFSQTQEEEVEGGDSQLPASLAQLPPDL